MEPYGGLMALQNGNQVYQRLFNRSAGPMTVITPASSISGRKGDSHRIS